jgi:hypothetical protein
MLLVMALGAAVVVRIMLPVWRARGDPLSKAFVFEIGVRPSGPNGTWTGRDHLRNGLLGLLNTAICVGLSMAALRIEDRAMNLSTKSYIAGGAMFVFGFLALLLLIQAVLELSRAPFTKPWKVEPGAP